MTSRSVLLVNFRNDEDIYPPFGIMYCADALEKAGFPTDLFHDTESGLDALIDRVDRERPLFVGFSTITGPQLRPTIEASRRVHALGVPVVWGGVHATIMPLDVLKEDYVDYVVVNEGEETVQVLARMLARDEPLPTARKPGALNILGDNSTAPAGELGLAYKDVDGTPRFPGERLFIEDLDQYRPRWDKLDVEQYLIPSGPYTRAIPVYISRGCPFRCGFCYNEVVMKRTWRQHSDEFIVDQITWLKDNYRIDSVDYADDYLFGRPKPMKRLVEKVGMPWSGQVRVQLLTPKFVQWMHDTGCQWVNIGVESGSQAVLDNMDKDQKDWQVEWGIRNLVEYAPGVEANCSFMVGLPDETRRDREINFEIMERLSSLSNKVRCSISVYMPYPGTPLWPKALAAGYEPPPQQDGWCDLNLDKSNTPWMDEEEARVMCEISDILFVGRSDGHWVLTPYYARLKQRWRTGNFKNFWEGRLKQRLMDSPLQPAMRWAIDRLVDYNRITHKGPIHEPS